MPSTTRIVALSAGTSLIVSTLVLSAGSQLLLTSNAATASVTTNQAAQLEQTGEEDSSVIGVVHRAEPAVASVIISKDLPVIERYYEEVPFGRGGTSIRLPRVRQRGTELQEIGGGTAFFVTDDGLMLTNKHVVSDEEATYTVILNDGRTLEADVVARDFLTDIALLKVQGSGFPYLELSANDEPILGQTVVAIGNALAEFRNTVSVGVISGLQRTITAGNPSAGTLERLSRIIQTDAAINEGNSGGPLLDLSGDVIGMNTAVASQAQNIGFAIPVDDLRRVVESYRRFGRIVRPYLGVRYLSVTEDIADELHLPTDEGVLISGDPDSSDPAIVPDSPAAKAGLREGDVILEADGTRLTEDIALADIIQRKQPGDALSLLIVRDGDEQELEVRLEEWQQ